MSVLLAFKRFKTIFILFNDLLFMVKKAERVGRLELSLHFQKIRKLIFHHRTIHQKNYITLGIFR